MGYLKEGFPGGGNFGNIQFEVGDVAIRVLLQDQCGYEFGGSWVDPQNTCASLPLVDTHSVGTYERGISESHMSGLIPHSFGQIVHPWKYPRKNVNQPDTYCLKYSNIQDLPFPPWPRYDVLGTGEIPLQALQGACIGTPLSTSPFYSGLIIVDITEGIRYT